MLAAAFGLLSLVPIFGYLVWPLISFFYVKRIVGFHFAVFLVFLSVIWPNSKLFLTKQLLQTITANRLIGRELLEPYLTRTEMSSREKRDWLSKHRMVIYGFTMVFYPFTFIPIIGPISYVLAQISIANLLLQIANKL